MSMILFRSKVKFSAREIDLVFAGLRSALGRHYIETATEAELQGRAKRACIALQSCIGCSSFVVAIENRMKTCSREPPPGRQNLLHERDRRSHQIQTQVCAARLLFGRHCAPRLS
ncbi:hypothetical protein [Microvirus mar46]|uniref:Uncharacterized protein n=1 Tax=Microvirus mar46 TaxID=2851181 RepID=A0A8F5ML61_9VIRU|nr:hypothetical protein [Microvirus mar46]